MLSPCIGRSLHTPAPATISASSTCNLYWWDIKHAATCCICPEGASTPTRGTLARPQGLPHRGAVHVRATCTYIAATCCICPEEALTPVGESYRDTNAIHRPGGDVQAPPPAVNACAKLEAQSWRASAQCAQASEFGYTAVLWRFTSLKISTLLEVASPPRTGEQDKRNKARQDKTREEKRRQEKRRQDKRRVSSFQPV